MQTKKGIQIILDWLPISKIKLPIVACKATVKKKYAKSFRHGQRKNPYWHCRKYDTIIRTTEIVTP